MTAPEPVFSPSPLDAPALAAWIQADPALGRAHREALAAGDALARAAAGDRPGAALTYTLACAGLGHALLAALPLTLDAARPSGPSATAPEAECRGAVDLSRLAGRADTAAQGDDLAEDEPTAPAGARLPFPSSHLGPGGGAWATAARATADGAHAGARAPTEAGAGPAEGLPASNYTEEYATNEIDNGDEDDDDANDDAGPSRTSRAAVPPPVAVSASPPLQGDALAGALAALSHRMKGGDPARASVAIRMQSPPTVTLSQLLEALGPPTPLMAPGSAEAELRRLRGAVDRAAEWVALPAADHQALVAVVTLRARALQERLNGEDGALDALFGKLTEHSATHRPGYVHGLNRAHAPQRGSWAADLEQATAAAGRLAAHAKRTLAPTKSGVKAKAKAHPAASGAAPAQRPTPAIAPAVQAFCCGKSALLMGAERLNEGIIEGLRANLGLVALDWESAKKQRTAEGKVKAIRAGEYPLVIVLKQFMSHRVTDALVPACNASATPIAWVNRGYGVAQVVAAVAKLADSAERSAG